MGTVALAINSSSGMMVTSVESTVLVVGRLVGVEGDCLLSSSVVVDVFSSLGITWGSWFVVDVCKVAEKAAACRGST